MDKKKAPKKDSKRAPTKTDSKTGKFQKGTGGGPGRKKKNPAYADIKKLDKDEVRLKLTAYLRLSLEQLDAILDDSSRLVFDHWIAQIAKQGIKGGDTTRLNFMFDRLIGKVKDEVEHSVVKPLMIERPNGAVIELTSEEVKGE